MTQDDWRSVGSTATSIAEPMTNPFASIVSIRDISRSSHNENSYFLISHDKKITLDTSLQSSQFSASKLLLRDLRIHNLQIRSLHSSRRSQYNARRISGKRPSPHPIFDVSTCFRSTFTAFIANVCLLCFLAREEMSTRRTLLCV